MQEITKLCADHLRTFAKDNHNIKLKASHAHELVAAFFGYHSRAALLADTITPLSKLPQAEIIVLEPTVFGQRRKNLQDLSSDLPNNRILIETIYSILRAEQWILKKEWTNFVDLAKFLADEHLSQQLMSRTDPDRFHVEVEVIATDNGMLLKVFRKIRFSTEKPFFDLMNDRTTIFTIKLPRLAGHIGYGKPEVMRTFVTGLR